MTALEDVDPTPGTKLGFQAALGFIALCLDASRSDHIMWARRRLAGIQAVGYNFPPMLRRRLSDAWGIDVTRFWMPEDAPSDEAPDRSPMVRSLREFAEFRALPARDQQTEALREMAGLFNTLGFAGLDGKSPSGSSVSGESASGSGNGRV